MIIFKLGEILARYKITGADLARELDVKESTVSNWRRDKHTPTFKHLDEILNAISRIGDQERLEAHPLAMKDVLEWWAEDNNTSQKTTTL